MTIVDYVIENEDGVYVVGSSGKRVRAQSTAAVVAQENNSGVTAPVPIAISQAHCNQRRAAYHRQGPVLSVVTSLSLLVFVFFCFSENARTPHFGYISEVNLTSLELRIANFEVQVTELNNTITTLRDVRPTPNQTSLATMILNLRLQENSNLALRLQEAELQSLRLKEELNQQREKNETTIRAPVVCGVIFILLVTKELIVHFWFQAHSKQDIEQLLMSYMAYYAFALSAAVFVVAVEAGRSCFQMYNNRRTLKVF